MKFRVIDFGNKTESYSNDPDYREPVVEIRTMFGLKRETFIRDRYNTASGVYFNDNWFNVHTGVRASYDLKQQLQAAFEGQQRLRKLKEKENG